ncbi:MAG: zinc-ribbon domain-containing protein [Thermoplasmata archaeon]|nr:zinc-ribbon domain-containing protein [Thermoplasmata archaeon]
MEKYCTKCRNELKKDVKFCTSCGFKVEEIKEEPEPIVEQSEPTIPVKKEKREPKPTPPKKEIPLIIPPESKSKKQSKPVDKIIIPAILVALILSIAAIILSFAIGGADLSEGSVDTETLASNSVTTGKIVDGTITDEDIIVSGISNIAETSINSDHIIDNVIDLRHLTPDLYKFITGIDEIANGSITSDKIADLTIDTKDIKNNSITSIKIANGAITSEDIGDGEVTFSKMETKIRFGTTSVLSNETINHNLGGTPTSVIVTPIFDGSNYIIHANIVSITNTQFTEGLWKETIGPNPEISEVISDVTISWIAMR